MNAMQGWVFLLVLAALGARGLDRLRLSAADLTTVGVAMGLAIVQRALIDQVALDEPLVAPLLLGLPVVAALRGGLRAGLAAAVGVWLGLTTVAAVMPVALEGELPQEGFVLAAVFAALLAGGASAVPRRARAFAPLVTVGWIGYFLVRDASLVQSPTIWAVVLLAVAWTGLGVALLPPRVGVA